MAEQRLIALARAVDAALGAATMAPERRDGRRVVP
jgi:hypothetical protein